GRSGHAAIRINSTLMTRSCHGPCLNSAAQQAPAITEVCYDFGREHSQTVAAHERVRRPPRHTSYREFKGKEIGCAIETNPTPLSLHALLGRNCKPCWRTIFVCAGGAARNDHHPACEEPESLYRAAIRRRGSASRGRLYHRPLSDDRR